MALGAKGLRTTLGILLGGVAQQVVEYAHWPVLVVRAPYAGLRRVLLLVDGSAYSQRALAYFARFPLPEDLEITLLHVLPPQADVMLEPPVDPRRVGARPAVDVDPSVARSAAAEERAGQQLLARAAAALQATGVAAQQQLLRGDAATEIIR
jgi:nucleotide-binding universal stress UspA family protein